MSLAELIPSFSTLSRVEKLQLIRLIAEDLTDDETPGRSPDLGDEEDAEDDRIRRSVRKVGLRNALGRMEESP